VGQDPEELKQEIAQTREELAGTLDELGEKVSPKAAAGRATSSAAMTLKRLRHAPIIDTLLGAQYAPLLPLTVRTHLHRWRPRRYRPDHVLVPEGYTAELVAKHFNEPVHCFDEQGSCYVIECGHKIEAKPRVLKSTSTSTPASGKCSSSCRRSAGTSPARSPGRAGTTAICTS
jgi:hypothetical protein